MKEVALLSEKRCHLVSFGVISKGMIEKIAKSGLCYEDLNQFMKNAEDKIQAERSMKEVALLSEKRCHLVSFGVISKGMIEKIAKSGLCYQDLNQFMKNAEDKIQALRSVRTTKSKKTISSVNQYFKG